MRRLLFCLALSCLAAGARAQAQAPAPSSVETDEARPGYKAAFQAGLDEFDRGNYVEARARFAEAHAIWPSARTWRVLGYCAYELAEYPAAIDLLERALGASERPLTDTMRAETQDLLRRARGYVASITIVTKPADASVQIDGADAVLDARNAALLAVGSHAFDVRAPAYYPAHREVQVVGSTPQTVTFELTALPSAAAADARADTVPLRKKWWLWAGVATVATAALVTGLVVGLHDPGTRDPTGGISGVTIPAGPTEKP